LAENDEAPAGWSLKGASLMQWAITAEHDFKLKSNQMECCLSNSAALSILGGSLRATALKMSSVHSHKSTSHNASTTLQRLGTNAFSVYECVVEQNGE
jgi:hypothetical protein